MTQLEVDPDPTPTASPWEEYLAAAQSLDALHRETMSGVTAEEEATTRAARAQLTELLARVERQRAALTGEVVQARLATPPLLPTAEERASAFTALGDNPAAVAAALRHARALLDDADAWLATRPTGTPWWRSPPWLLALVTGAVLTLLTGLGLSILLLLLLFD